MSALAQPPVGSETVPLNQLKSKPQLIDCPFCNDKTQTRVDGRSEGKKDFYSLFFWPLPGRQHYFEKTNWFCGKCGKQVATQKYGKELNVLT